MSSFPQLNPLERGLIRPLHTAVCTFGMGLQESHTKGQQTALSHGRSRYTQLSPRQSYNATSVRTA
ncbi:hypothetical protein WJX82_005542 [Trebouxia sp. C0006]